MFTPSLSSCLCSIGGQVMGPALLSYLSGKYLNPINLIFAQTFVCPHSFRVSVFLCPAVWRLTMDNLSPEEVQLRAHQVTDEVNDLFSL
jgi:hypothetical protein